MVEEDNITVHGTTTSPLTKHVDESFGDNPLQMDELKLPDENSLLLIEIPSFSLGLSQEEMQVRNDYEVTWRRWTAQHSSRGPCDPKIKVFSGQNIDYVDEAYSSLRDKFGKKKTLTVANGIQVSSEDLCNIVERAHQMPPKLLRVDPDCEMTYDRIYFPFNIDKYHWVGVCLDIMSVTLHVIRNMSLRSESLMKKDLNPFANVFPYLINPVIGGDSRNLPKPFILSRSKGIPQNPNPRDSAVMTALLIQAHASSGVDGCKEVTPVALHSASKQLTVMVYRAICPV
ncbi:hypothetical protein F2Q70_00015225 [Brassica cretica]|uniref:Ubiquitin-like protease family profile domain-containing protein n=1 Tax=Brassica cretica TaxID=69181 RepID=A0A8S9KMW3_BRACR|nr:hypothetical protein F2Q70_00015225 [Brassica cretica]KAF2596214.1 hypothetical protein F2Q68_00008317 [Brassica cretica]